MAKIKSAIIICDMWNKHWSRGASERIDELAPKINETITILRKRGYQIIHSPSDVVRHYKNTPARKRAIGKISFTPPREIDHPDPPLPIDDSDGGSDTNEIEQVIVWTKQHPKIKIDQTTDSISDSGLEIYNILKSKKINKIYILGVHANMCILDRSFGIKQMVKWGIDVTLVSDLTDSMYNPEKPPYVTHDQGTQLIIEFIEKYWCSTIMSKELLSREI